MKKKVIAVVGPTACGKTDTAVRIAEEIGGEIVSADSRLVYKGFNIAVSKPSMEERGGVAHHLIDIVEPEFDYSAGNFCDDAEKAIEDIISRGKIPIVAGGTGLYFRVLLENYNLPRVKADYDLRTELDLKSKEELLAELKNIDYFTWERVKDANKRRIVRAIEVIKILGNPLSELNLQKEPEYDTEWIMPPIKSRDWLYDRINKRVDLMAEQGLVAETKYLLEKHGRIKNITATIGYKEIISYLDGHNTLDEALNKLKQHTRNYAKKQLTWFRRNEHLKISC